jgi:hypothetical protein
MDKLDSVWPKTFAATIVLRGKARSVLAVKGGAFLTQKYFNVMVDFRARLFIMRWFESY